VFQHTAPATHRGERSSEAAAIVAQLEAGPAALKPRVTLQADEQITPTAWARAESRLREWVESRIAHLLKPLFELQSAVDAEGEAAQERLMKRLATSAKVAKRFADKRDAALQPA
jgi:hypothetical protein